MKTIGVLFVVAVVLAGCLIRIVTDGIESEKKTREALGLGWQRQGAQLTDSEKEKLHQMDRTKALELSMQIGQFRSSYPKRWSEVKNRGKDERLRMLRGCESQLISLREQCESLSRFSEQALGKELMAGTERSLADIRAAIEDELATQGSMQELSRQAVE